MKSIKALIIFVIAISCLNSFGQTPDDFNLEPKTAAECKAAEPVIIKAANYILSTPYEKGNGQRADAVALIVRWMEATPDYAFTLDGDLIKMTKGRTDLFGLYLAAMTKYCMENNASAKNEKLVKLNTITQVLDYCENEKNNSPMTKQLKKLSEAKAKGELEKAL